MGLYETPICIDIKRDDKPWTALTAQLRLAELYNGRVAMFAVLGVLFVEAIGRGPWWTAPFRVRPAAPSLQLTA